MLEKYNEQRRRRYASDEAFRKKCIDKAKKWNKDNPEKVKSIRKKYNTNKKKFL